MRYVITDSEVEFTAIRAQGPGGQHVNKAATAMQLRFSVPASGLPEPVKARLLAQADSRISSDGVVVIKAQGSRSQEVNKFDALARLRELITRAESAPKIRKPTQPTLGSRRRRLENKTRKSTLKSCRAKVAL
jgi:ribosome-associated protein